MKVLKFPVETARCFVLSCGNRGMFRTFLWKLRDVSCFPARNPETAMRRLHVPVGCVHSSVSCGGLLPDLGTEAGEPLLCTDTEAKEY